MRVQRSALTSVSPPTALSDGRARRVRAQGVALHLRYLGLAAALLVAGSLAMPSAAYARGSVGSLRTAAERRAALGETQARPGAETIAAVDAAEDLVPTVRRPDLIVFLDRYGGLLNGAKPENTLCPTYTPYSWLRFHAGTLMGATRWGLRGGVGISPFKAGPFLTVEAGLATSSPSFPRVGGVQIVQSADIAGWLLDLALPHRGRLSD